MPNRERARCTTTVTLGLLAGLGLALSAGTLAAATAPPDVGTPLDPPVSPAALEFIDADECLVFELDESQEPLWFECTRVDDNGDVGIAYITPKNDPVAAWDWATARPDYNEFAASFFYIRGGGFLYLHNFYGEMFDVWPWPDLEAVDVDCAPFPETFPGEGLCPETPQTFPEDTASDETVADVSEETATGIEAAADAGDSGFVMPDVVGMNLQDAQDLIQSVSGDMFFFTSSVDATGDDRRQLVDSNWYVCGQNVQAGTTVGNDAEITFAVVKTDEVCP